MPLQVDKKSSEDPALRMSVPMRSHQHRSAAAAEVLMLTRNANGPGTSGAFNALRGVRAAPSRRDGFVIARGKRIRASAPWSYDLLMTVADHNDNKKSQRHGYVISRGRKWATRTETQAHLTPTSSSWNLPRLCWLLSDNWFKCLTSGSNTVVNLWFEIKIISLTLTVRYTAVILTIKCTLCLENKTRHSIVTIISSNLNRFSKLFFHCWKAC